MAAKKKAKGRKGSKKRPAKGANEITITPAERKKVLTTLDDLRKDADDIASAIEDVHEFLYKVDFKG